VDIINRPISELAHGGLTFYAATPAELLAHGVPASVVLPVIKAALKVAVDDRAEALRGLLITPGAGQAMEYQEAQAQAFAVLEDPAAALAAPGRFQMLAVSVGVDLDPQTNAPATDLVGVARSIKAAYDGWQMAGAAIRGARLRGKAAIDAAVDLDAAAAAFAAVEWPALG
jgi:hypothetical protein